MARRFQFLVKKRGQRRTGSRIAAAIGEGTFFSGLLLVGFLALTALVATRVITIPGVPRSEPGSGLWLGLIVATSLVLIGAGGFLYTLLNFGASVERRTALAQKARALDPRVDRKFAANNFPTIPEHESLYLSPGTNLKYRLPLVTPPIWGVLGFMSYAMVWSGLFMAMLVTSLKGFGAGQPRWAATALLVPLLYMSVRVTREFLMRWMEMTSVGPTCAEVSDLPLLPGNDYELCIVQAGRGEIKSLEAQLVCEEEATFCQGTNVRTERRAVYAERLFRLTDLTIGPNKPLTQLDEFTVPKNAMHSVQLTNNAIQWRLVVDGRMRRGTAFRRSFPVVVYPNSKTTN